MQKANLQENSADMAAHELSENTLKESLTEAQKYGAMDDRVSQSKGRLGLNYRRPCTNRLAILRNRVSCMKRFIE